MSVKSILNEISAESGTNAKMAILKQYKENNLLVSVLYKACSRRVKFYIKQIPDYIPKNMNCSNIKGELHKYTRNELEKLQTVPINYTKEVSFTQACMMLGNGWTVDVVSHILKNII